MRTPDVGEKRVCPVCGPVVATEIYRGSVMYKAPDGMTGGCMPSHVWLSWPKWEEKSKGGDK